MNQDITDLETNRTATSASNLVRFGFKLCETLRICLMRSIW